MNRLALALPALLLGCTGNAPTGQPGAEPAAAPVQRQADPVRPAAEGATVLAVGQVLEIALEGNAGTGHAWELVSDGAPQLVPLPVPPPEATPVDPGQPPAVGAPATQRWQFRAAQPGETTLHLVYRRPWETDVAPAREATFEVVVGEAAASP